MAKERAIATRRCPSSRRRSPSSRTAAASRWKRLHQNVVSDPPTTLVARSSNASAFELAKKDVCDVDASAWAIGDARAGVPAHHHDGERGARRVLVGGTTAALAGLVRVLHDGEDHADRVRAARGRLPLRCRHADRRSTCFHVRKVIWPNSVRALQLATDLKRTATAALVTYGGLSIIARIGHTVLGAARGVSRAAGGTSALRDQRSRGNDRGAASHRSSGTCAAAARRDRRRALTCPRAAPSCRRHSRARASRACAGIASRCAARSRRTRPRGRGWRRTAARRGRRAAEAAESVAVPRRARRCRAVSVLGAVSRSAAEASPARSAGTSVRRWCASVRTAT